EAGNLLFGNIDTWLLWTRTGGTKNGLHITDVTNASRTQLMNLGTLDWDPGLLEELLIPPAVLPRIVASSEVYGEARTPALLGVSISGILGDQQAALVGQACFKPGESKNTYGTGCFLLMNTGEKPIASAAGLITTVAYKIAKERRATPWRARSR
ncbi:MAG: glpK, partial [Gammaproteobacteria bacterium]|nr:glpK [Gammaproteobacteria bacterium]